MRIVNIGSLNIDNVYTVDTFLQPGETKSSKGFATCCGGKGLNQSIAAARAGNDVCHAGMLGEDGDMLLALLRQNAVDTALMQRVAGRNGHTVIQVDENGQNCILLYGGSNQQLTEAYIDRVLDGCGPEDVVLLQNEVNLVGEIIDKAHARGLRVVFNAAPMDRRVPAYHLEKLALLIVNEIEGAQLTGNDSDQPEKIMDALTSRYPDTGILLTLGKRGACCRLDGKRCAAGIYDAPVTDTTAAGDTFIGFFLYGWLQGLPVEAALDQATAASAICVMHPGAADSIPARAEVLQALRDKRFGDMQGGMEL